MSDAPPLPSGPAAEAVPGPGISVVPDMSIVIVSWNTRGMLRDCLASVRAGLAGFAAEGRAAEVIVVDNASTDGSPTMVAEDFPEAILIRNAENRGFAAANNQAFAVARGRTVLLLNSDTLVHGAVLARSLAYLEARPGVGAMGCRVLNTDGSVQLTCSRFPTLTNLFLLTSGLGRLSRPGWFGRYHMRDWARDSERPVEVISGCYMLVRRAVFSAVGGLDEAFYFYGEETDWCRRMRDAGWELRFAPVGEITHHGGGSVRRLNHRRDVMLTGALVRLQRKHGGWLAGAVCWAMLAGFNASRALFWSLAAIPARGGAAAERARHFRRVLGETGATWPREV